jgi:hypothetical protein
MAFDVASAKKEGYSDQEIADYLAQQKGFDVESARKEGYTNADIVGHLSQVEATNNQSQAETERLLSKQATKQTQESPSIMEQMFGMGSPTARFVKGAVVDPLLAVNQLASRAFPEAVQKGADQVVNQYEQATQQARGRVGSTGFDPYQLAGAIASPASRIGLTAKGAGVGTKIAQGAGGGVAGAMLTPVEQKDNEEDNFVLSKFIQAGLGGVLGGAIPLTVQTAKTITDIVKELPLSAAAKQRAFNKYISSLVGSEDEAVVKVLREAEEIVPGSKPTTSQALAETPAGVNLIKEQERVAKQQSVPFIQREAEQQAARQSELARTFGTDAELAATKAERTAVTQPLREGALKQADVYGSTVPRLQADIEARQLQGGGLADEAGAMQAAEQQIQQQAGAWTPVPGMPRFPGRYHPRIEEGVARLKEAATYGSANAQKQAEAQFKRMQMQSVTDEGFFPLDTNAITERVDKLLASPDTRSNSLLADALTSLRTKLDDLSDPQYGIIKSNALYNVRKEIGEDIQKFLTDRGNPSFGAKATEAESQIKALLDNAITKASGTNLWKDYLTNFAKYSKKIDQMEVGKALRTKLGADSLGDVEKAGSFANAVQNAAQTIKRTTGVARHDKLEDFATPEQVSSVNKVFADLSRNKKAEDMARKAASVEGVKFEGIDKIPPWISSSIAATKVLLNTLRRGSQKEFDVKISELLLEPNKLADVIEALPKQQIDQLVPAMLEKMSPQVRLSFENALTVGARGSLSETLKPSQPYTVDLEVSRQQLDDNFRRLNSQ